MALSMKPACEKCEAGVSPAGDAYICSHECTFCPSCARTLGHRCPNCGGELVRRPKRRSDPEPPHYA
ncbi:MAG: DUF1272 domain-containing protein [Kiloniellales bacterium]|nr:DUF1272 domain-containing protein [Kiloniellales bacterium]